MYNTCYYWPQKSNNILQIREALRQRRVLLIFAPGQTQQWRPTLNPDGKVAKLVIVTFPDGVYIYTYV